MGVRSQDALERLPTESTIYTVDLDSGSYHWLLEILEAKAKMQRSFEGYQRLVARTLLSFEAAKQPVDVPIPDEIPPRRRRVIPPPKTPKRGSKK